MGFFDALLLPIRWVVAWILALAHEGFTFFGMAPDSGWTWAASIAVLTIVVRAALIPLFVKQIKSQRKMQLIQPDLQRLQAKYKGKKDQFSRQAMVEEQQALFKKHGTSPFASCLPLLVQIPIFLSLYRVIVNSSAVAKGEAAPIGGMTKELAIQADSANLLGISFSETFLTGDWWVKVVCAILIVIMAGMQFYTQRHMMTKNMSEAAMNNPFMQQQKMLLYVMPVVFGIGGIYFPFAVLIYWVVSNTWTMVQQIIVVRNMPAPGSQAERDLMARRAKKGKSPLPGAEPIEIEEEPQPKNRQREQPMSKARQKQKRKKKRR